MHFTGDLGQVIKGEIVGRENDEEIIVFETVGVATQDLVAAREIYDKAVAAGVGSTGTRNLRIQGPHHLRFRRVARAKVKTSDTAWAHWIPVSPRTAAG